MPLAGRPRTRSLFAAVLTACGLLALASAPSALAHAQLLGTSPVSGTTVPVQPSEVIFKFNQNVGGTAGAVRVYNAQGDEVDNLDVSHPDGNEHWMGVGLKPHLPDGTYTGTYRVISADTHIVYGGLVFNVGHAGAAPRYTVAGLIGRNEAGHVTKVAFGVVRALDYLSIALMIGGLAFLYAVWASALGALAGPEPRWTAASDGFARRAWRLLSVAVVVGVVVSLLGVLLQGATAAGVSLWSSLRGPILESTLESRFGWVWGVRALDWVLLGAVLLGARAAGRDPVPRLAYGDAAPAGLDAGADGEGPPRPTVTRPPGWLLAVLGLGCAYLAITPALAGHASIQSPTGLFFPSDVIHVLAASVWVGGIACLLLALPAATRRLEGPERTRLLFGTLRRFSPLALASVIAIAVTGAVQAYIDVRSLHGLLHTTYGLLILAKTALLGALVVIGWMNRERLIPALRRIAAAGGEPRQAGVLARRTLRGELLLMMCVFGVTAALISYAPPIDAASGPFSTNTSLGPALLEMTVEPAKVGLNTIHLYLIDAKTGVQYTATKELTATARLPSKHIGPLPLKASLAGPGHYILTSAVLSPGGTWAIEIVDRVSEFEQFTRVVKVPVS
ncbi:MAG TPA: CopD family protein [Solirubrobacteraceae bacterium]|nr:CopD family protein [Solirubrobacteraceae bacterium]